MFVSSKFQRGKGREKRLVVGTITLSESYEGLNGVIMVFSKNLIYSIFKFNSS